jgi:ATP-binding cassette, subfamily B, bacterial
VLTSDVNQLATALDAVWALGDMAITAALLLGGIFYTSTSAGLIALAPMPALVGLSFLFAPRIQAAHATLRDQVVTISGQVSDSLAGFETIKGFTAERGESERLRLASATYREKSGEALRSLAKFPLALETSVLGALIAVTSVNGRLVRASKLSFGRFNAVSMLTSHLVFPLLSVGVYYDRIAGGRSAYGHIQSTLDRPVESDAHLPRLLHSEIRGEVVFQDVVFSYPGAPTLFNGLSLRFPSRKTTAVVGFSGSGKSTLIKLLLRFRSPDSGRIEIDGRDIAGLQRQSVRQAVAVVSQDMKLLHRTVEDNIRLGDPAADRSAVEHYARLAQAEEFILKLPDGYATVLGREGTTLSGGERQRLGIARALMKPAPILVFDEATSNLDSRTELAIHDMLDGFRERCTVILIAHRLATVRDADHIYLLENGRLAEEGTHDELLSRNGNYRMLWDMQGGNWL